MWRNCSRLGFDTISIQHWIRFEPTTFQTWDELANYKTGFLPPCTFLVDNEFCCLGRCYVDVDVVTVIQKCEKLLIESCQSDVSIHAIAAECDSRKLDLCWLRIKQCFSTFFDSWHGHPSLVFHHLSGI